MKLSRALLIVLVLHVVAVAGIIAFNTIKTHERPQIAKAQPNATPTAKAEPIAPPAISAGLVKRDANKPARSPEKIVAKIGPKSDEPVRVEKAIPVSNSAKTYVVEKGDNPVKIAKKFHVPYDDLLAANHIDNPHKLKVGQKLVIPSKAPPKAKRATSD
jgi:2',3'-cyclic-nucleotide 2'-phosphodiesterase/3'-nucleotidase